MRFCFLDRFSRLPYCAALCALIALALGLAPRAAQGQSSITGEEVECTDGTADRYPCDNTDLLSVLSIDALGGDAGTDLNDVWGWTDPQTSTEYALVGRTDGTAFVDVSTPTEPIYVGELPTHTTASTWRDVKVYDNHAYIVSEAPGHGMQVFDLTRLRDVDATNMPVTFDHDGLYERIHSAHNIVINPETGYAYAVGSNGGGKTCGGGLHMINIQDPKNPTFEGCFVDPSTGRSGTGYSHDAQCVVYEGPDTEYQGREVCIGLNETAISVADVTDKDNPQAISTAEYPDYGYVHQGWFDEQQRYFYQNDELDELQGKANKTRTLVWDMKDLDNPKLVNQLMLSEESTDHNLYIKGSTMYEANYTSGLRVLDLADPEHPDEAAFFDTVPGNNAPTFAGAWSTYPFFDRNIVLVSSIGEGLFVVQPEPSPFLSFTGAQQERGVQLQWAISATAQTNRIEIDHKPPEATNWQLERTLARSASPGVQNYDFFLDNLRPGTHQFRVRHISTEGTAQTSAIRTVQILPSAPVAVEGPTPNPTRNQSIVRLTLRESQTLRVELYDVTGRRVRLLHDGRLDAGVIHRFRVRASRRASGTYFLRIQGESVQASRKVVVVR